MTEIRVGGKMALLLRYLLGTHQEAQPGTFRGAHMYGVGPSFFYLAMERLIEAEWVRTEWETVPENVNRPPRQFCYLTEKGVERATEAVRLYERRPLVLLWRKLT